jgi:DNA mismatch repair protein MutL
MPSKIKILSGPVISRIAAGEVVERPSSIVKELIDNSIDAKSSEIVIRLKEGGKSFISISDNGEGMSPEDALLAFERHATSKLQSEEDLESIKTLGFRGEALPSIAAVSQIRLSTQSKAERGVELQLYEGKVQSHAEIARSTGTEITISCLFENYPVRKKFLRSASAELANVVSVVNQLALVHFQTSFELVHHERKVLRYSAVKNLRDRIFQIYGGETIEKMVALNRDEDPNCVVAGYASLPPHTYGTRSVQEIFVNQRPIKNPMINHAVYEAYSSHLMKGQHPAYFLMINMDPARVDVNVHPSKKEVRFSDSSMIHQRVYQTVKDSFIKRDVFPGREKLTDESQDAGRIEFDPKSGIKNAIREYVILSDHDIREYSPDHRDLFKDDDSLKENSFKVLGQFQSMFILVQSGQTLHIIDQHAAHERVLFERYLARSLNESIVTQPLLIPQTLEFNIKEILTLREYEESIMKIGIEIDFFGENTVLIRSLPEFMAQSEIKPLMTDLIEEIQLLQGFSSEKEKREKLFATLACHAAIKAGQILGHPEIASLYRDLSILKNPLTCPHGRPITRNFSLTDLEKMFCRI